MGNQPTSETTSVGPSDDLVARLAGLQASHAAASPGDPEQRYSFGAIFASGGLGTIRRAFDRRLRREVAVKEIRQSSRGSIAEQRFLREAWITARLEHPAIVPIHDIGHSDGGEPYFCMKLVDGISLHALVRERPRLRDRIALLSHVIAVAEALAYAHDRGIVHRDLKPANVLVGAFGETVVIDWGLAKELTAPDDRTTTPDLGALTDSADGDLTRTGEFVGTLPFMPPEQARGAACGTRADVYAIGAILYFVLTNRIPYEHESRTTRLAALLAGPPQDVGRLEPSIPGDLQAIVRKAMAREPEARYASAKQLATDLRCFQEGRLVAARIYSTHEILGHFVRRHRTILRLGAVSVTLLLALAVYSYASIASERRAADEQRGQAVAAQQSEAQARARAETSARAAQRVALERSIDTARRDLFERREPQRALVSLAAAYRLDDSNEDVRRMLHEATARADNLQFVLYDVTGLDFSGSGRHLVTWNFDDSVSVWDTATGIEERRVSPGGPVAWAAFVPGTEDQLLILSDTGLERYERGAAVWRLDADSIAGYGTRLLPEPGGTRMLLVGADGSAAVELSNGAMHRIPAMIGTALPGMDKSGWFGASVLLTVSDLTDLWRQRTPATLVRHDAAGRLLHRSGRFLRNTAHSHVFSPDGSAFSYVRSIDASAAMLEDTVTGKRRRLDACGKIDTGRNAPSDPTAAFTPDGRSILRLIGGRQLARWNTRTLACEVLRTDLEEDYERLYLTADGESAILAGKTGVIGVYDVTTLMLQERFNADARRIEMIAIDPGQRRIAVKNVDGELRIWQIGDPRRLASRPIHDLLVGPELGQAMALARDATGESRLHALQVRASGELAALPFGETTTTVRLVEGSATADSVSSMDRAEEFYEVWSLVDRRRVATKRPTHGCACQAARNELMLAEAIVHNGHRISEQQLPSLDLLTMTPMPRGLFVEFRAHRATLLDLGTGAAIAHLQFVNGNFSPDGNNLFSSRYGTGELSVHDTRTGELVHELATAEPDGHVNNSGDPVVTFSPDGQTFAFARNDGSIRLWDAATFAPMGTLYGHHAWARHLVFSPSSDYLVSLAEGDNSDGQTFLWDMNTLTGRRLDGPDVATAVFHPAHDLLALGGSDGVVRLWNVRTGGQVSELRGHTRPVSRIGFVDGDRLLTAAKDDRAIVWQLGVESRSTAALDRFVDEVVAPDLRPERLPEPK